MSAVETKARSTSLSLGSLSLLDVAFGLALLSLAPMVWIQCNSLWNRPHLQFFPMAWAAFGYFFYQRCGGLSTTNSKGRLWVAGVLVLTSLAASVEAVLISSPWLSYVAGVLLITAWMFVRAGAMQWKTLLAISSLLWITVPLPAGYDKKMIQYLQAQSSFAASSVLDVFRIPHLREGNILQLLDKRLFVDEACSGVDSLYALMAISLTLVLFMRQKFIVAFFALCMVLVWASCGNILRLVSIVFGLTLLGVDLSDGIPHTILGLVVFAIAFGCDFAFIRFLGYLTTPIPSKFVSPSSRSSTASSVSNFGGMATTPFGKLSIALSILFVFGFVSVGAYSTRVLSRGTIFRFPEFTDQSLQSLNENLQLPQTLSAWRFVQKEVVERSKGSVMGQFSHVWVYDAKGQMGTVSIDFPFRGFHLLDICYEGAGWKARESRAVVEKQLGESSLSNDDLAQIHFLDLSKDTGEFIFVAFVQFQLDGKPVRSSASGRGLERFEQTFLEPVTYQIQSMITSKVPLTESQKAEIEANLLSVATLVRPHFVGLETKN